MESLLAIVQQWVSSGSLTLAAGGAFVGGALTAMNPCVLVMVPLLIGFIGGMGEEMTTKKSFLYAAVFVLGFSLESLLKCGPGFCLFRSFLLGLYACRRF
ncbi:MAG: cytochrome c biogenesis protein CcdA [Deltaproteobacteria bacterium]